MTTADPERGLVHEVDAPQRLPALHVVAVPASDEVFELDADLAAAFAALIEKEPREVREAVRAVEHLLRVRVHGVIPGEPPGLFDGDAHGLA